MICPGCNRETEPSLFCHYCDVYIPDPAVGTRSGVTRRFAAQVLDGVAVWVILLLVLIFAGVAGAASESAGFSLITAFWAVLGYTIFALWFLSQGRTPGKWLVGIRVVDKRQGFNPGLGRMLVREIIGKFVSGFFLGFGYFWAVFDRDGQAWHDKIAGTVVVRRPRHQPFPAPAPSLQVTSAPGGVVQGTPAGKSGPTELPVSPVPAPGAGHFCGECGAKVEPGSRFCEICGAAQ